MKQKYKHVKTGWAEGMESAYERGERQMTLALNRWDNNDKGALNWTKSDKRAIGSEATQTDRNKIVWPESQRVRCVVVFGKLFWPAAVFLKIRALPLEFHLTSTLLPIYQQLYFHHISPPATSSIALLLFIQSQNFNLCKSLFIFFISQLLRVLSLAKARVMCPKSCISSSTTTSYPSSTLSRRSNSVRLWTYSIKNHYNGRQSYYYHARCKLSSLVSTITRDQHCASNRADHFFTTTTSTNPFDILLMSSLLLALTFANMIFKNRRDKPLDLFPKRSSQLQLPPQNQRKRLLLRRLSLSLRKLLHQRRRPSQRSRRLPAQRLPRPRRKPRRLLMAQRKR